jgi:hypothetical protein
MLWIAIVLLLLVVVVIGTIFVIRWREDHPPTLGEKGAEAFIQVMEDVEKMQRRR